MCEKLRSKWWPFRLFTLLYCFLVSSAQTCQDRALFGTDIHLGFVCIEGVGAGVDSGGRENEVRRTVPRLLIRFDTHPRWPPVTKGLYLDHFTEKMRDCEHSNYSLYHLDCPLILCVIN